MPRVPRLQVADAIHHITAKAARNLMLFTDRHDRDVFLAILGIEVRKANWVCHSYCLMGTHYHVLIETTKPNLGEAMKRLNWLYSRTFNARHGTRGHLFEARYSDRLVQSERHFIGVVRYIARNPVEAGICESPLSWEWSSYAATVRMAEPAPFLTTFGVLDALDDRHDIAVRQLRAIVED